MLVEPDAARTPREGAMAAPSHSLCEHVRGIDDLATSLVREVVGTVRDSESFVVDHLRRQPYRTIALAGGVGYVLGGGLQLRLVRLAATLAVRVVTAVAVRELGARILPPGQDLQPTRTVRSQTVPYREKP